MAIEEGEDSGDVRAELNTTILQAAAAVVRTAPVLEGEMNAGANSIGFTLQTATGDGSTTIDWTDGNKVKFTFGALNETLTFTDPSYSCAVQIILVQDSIGSRTITWPSGIKWAGKEEPELSTDPDSEDIISFVFDGTSYYGAATSNFGTV